MEAWGNLSKHKKKSQNSATKDGKTSLSGAPIKSDVLYTLAPIYHLSKIFGLLPVKFRKDKSGKYTGTLDIPEVLYGWALLSAFILAQCWGLYRDLRDGWRNSTRLSSETAITVTCSDVFAVISATAVAILGSPYRWKHLKAALNKIIEVDEKLGVSTSKYLRKYSIIVISCTYLYLIPLATMDYVSWHLSSANKQLQAYGDKGPINYGPLYIMYQVIAAFEIQYALILFNVGERFLKLNKSIENLTRTNMVIEYFRKDMGLAAPDPRKELAKALSFVSSDINSLNRIRRTNKVSDFPASNEGSGNGASDAIDQLITIHGTLSDVVIHINKAYGGSILVGTISCLIHLIITPYFLYTSIYSDNTASWYVLIIQIFWTMFHVYRVILFVQPCYMVTVKARITGALVSQALASNWEPEVRKQLEIFAIQLLQRPVEFSACGLFFLDRGLVTSIAGSVTTYLVILVQFQNADENTEGTKYLLHNATELLKNASSFKNISAFKI